MMARLEVVEITDMEASEATELFKRSDRMVDCEKAVCDHRNRWDSDIWHGRSLWQAGM